MFVLVLKSGTKINLVWSGKGPTPIDVFIESVKQGDNAHALFTVSNKDGTTMANVIRLPEIAAIIEQDS